MSKNFGLVLSKLQSRCPEEQSGRLIFLKKWPMGYSPMGEKNLTVGMIFLS